MRSTRSTLLQLIATSALLGCGTPTPTDDAGGDAGYDAAAQDSGTRGDAGGTDGGVDSGRDAGPRNDGGPDASAPDPNAILDVGGGGNRHLCVLLGSGSVRCWGYGPEGQLGTGLTETIGDDEPASAGTPVVLGAPAVQLSVGVNHACALLESGNVRCWGFGLDGQLGYGRAANVGVGDTPADVGDVPIGGRVVQVSAGVAHTCALLEGGRVRCWGFNGNGVLGYGHTRSIGDDELPSTAGDVDVGGRVTQISAGGLHTCALLDGGSMRCWGAAAVLGYGNRNDIGDDETPASAGDVPVGGRVEQITTGWQHTCALLEGGRVRCWGDWGKLGYPGITPGEWIGDEPDEIPALMGDVDVGDVVARIEAYNFHTCALLRRGAVRCWGGGARGNLGYGNPNDIGDDETPATAGDVDVGGVPALLGGGFDPTCVVLATGGLRCWGGNEVGQLGYGHTRNIGDDETPASAGDVPLF